MESIHDVASNRKQYWIKVSLTAVFLFIGLVFLFPLLYMVSGSLKFEADLQKYPIEWIPSRIADNYSVIFGKSGVGFGLFYLNSLKVSVISVVGLVFTSLLAAYGFCKINFKGRDTLFLIYMSTLMIPTQVTMVPRFLLYSSMGIYNSHWALILPGIFTAYGTFLLRQFLVSIPYELNESAYIDGAKDLRILFQIILPVIKPAIVTLVLLSVVWSWNDYENALLFLTNRKLYTVPIGLVMVVEEQVRILTRALAASTCAVIPPIVVFFVGQKYFIEGLTTGAVKG